MAFDANAYPNSSGLVLNRFLGVSANIDSISTTSGAVQVIGGIGMTGNLYSANVYTGNLTATGFFTGNGYYLTGITTYSDANVAAYLSTNGISAYTNANVAAYLSAAGITSYANANVAAYLSAAGITSYANANVAAYLLANTLTTGNIKSGNIFLNTTGISTAANSVQPKQYTDVMAVVFGL
jgi:hypothetical protein